MSYAQQQYVPATPRGNPFKPGSTTVSGGYSGGRNMAVHAGPDPPNLMGGSPYKGAVRVIAVCNIVFCALLILTGILTILALLTHLDIKRTPLNYFEGVAKGPSIFLLVFTLLTVPFYPLDIWLSFRLLGGALRMQVGQNDTVKRATWWIWSGMAFCLVQLTKGVWSVVHEISLGTSCFLWLMLRALALYIVWRFKEEWRRAEVGATAAVVVVEERSVTQEGVEKVAENMTPSSV